MIKRSLYTILLVAMTALVACHKDDASVVSPETPEREGYVTLNFETLCPDMAEVSTRAVDPDGVGVQNMTLFCFDAYGIFISTTQATIVADKPEPSTSGKFSASVSDDTRIIHFVANQNMTGITDRQFVGLTEAAVMAAMPGSSGKIVYWGRFAAPSGSTETIDTLIESAGQVTLYRNHARVSIAEWETADFTVTGFVTYNAPAFGTVAPYHETEGFVCPRLTGDNKLPFVTLPKNRAAMSEILDVDTDVRDYIFESENRSDDPISVIIRGKAAGSDEELYYRVMLVDENGEQLLICRNHHYIINIAGELSYGQPTFERALTAAATNNVWLSISDEINEVADNSYSLSVEDTSIILDESYAGMTRVITYDIASLTGAALTADDEATVSWVGENNVAANTLVTSFNPSTGRGEVTVSFAEMTADDMQSGTLLIKKGRLQRKVKIYIIKTQKFTPAWIDTQIYGGTVGGNVTFKFTIPETCPEELFPFNVYISVESLDIRPTSGMQLSVINSSDPDFGVNRGTHYKYVYTVDHSGPHSLYFENTHTVEEGVSHNLVIEAEFFEVLTKLYTFASHQREITVSGVMDYTRPGETEGEKIHYILVPRKVNAPVTFDMQMMDNSQTPAVAINAAANDEFFLYSRNLTYYKDGEEAEAGVTEFDCTFYPVDDTYWETSTNGRLMMFMPRTPEKVAPNVGKYSIYLKTIKPNSAELLRISSNNAQSNSALNTSVAYAGNSYRSYLFEMANYRPFRFAAQVAVAGGTPVGTWSEGENEDPVDNIAINYGAGQQVDISFDVTSFEGSDAKSANPFGTEFEIYIDAPMLEIDTDRLAACKLNASKLKAHPTIEGRFIYTVDANRDVERSFGSDDVHIADGTGVSQAGEHKTLPFKTKNIVSMGEIKISADESKVSYYTKSFNVTNRSIEGEITYGDDLATQVAVPADAFVVFQRQSDAARVGSFTIDSDGHYILRLRKEYDINIDLDKFYVDYTITTVDSLGDISTSAVYTSDRTNLITLSDLLAGGFKIQLVKQE